jgi:S-(hydroxymethyl)glutathione dehydrogenase/alcohol dehydrogenase
MKTQAAILAASKQDLIIDEIEINNPLQEGQVLVKIEKSGICGAQINEIDAVKGADKFLPHLLGHEGVGTVLEIGKSVNNIKVGDRVILHWRPGNGIQSETYRYTWRNKDLNSGWVTTFSQHAIVSENRLTPISKTVSSVHLPLLGCGLTTVFGSLENEVSIKLGDSVLILGVGAIGSLSIIASQLKGASEITAIDKMGGKTELAKSCGADSFYAINPLNLDDIIRKIISGIGLFDLVIDTTGDSTLISKSYEMLSKTGTLLIIGVMPQDQKLSINSLDLNMGKKILGTQGGRSLPQIDIPKLVRAIEKKLIPLERLFYKERKLSEINLSIQEVRVGAPFKQYINMW